MTIGLKIKQLRKDKRITQEKLAEHLNITCQAISRWENDLSYPEASLLPAIAHYFDVTIDALFGYENDSKKKKIEEYANNYVKFKIKGDVLSCIDLMETALLEFPNNYQFLLNLADSLLILKDKKREQLEKVSLICRRILENCVDDLIRQKALYMSVKALSLLGKKDKAYDTALKLPIMEYSKEYILHEVLPEAASIHESQKLLHKLVLKTAETLENLSMRKEYHLTNQLTIEEKIEYIEKANTLYKLFVDENNCQEFHQKFAWNYRRLSEMYLSKGDTSHGIKLFESAIQHAKAFDMQNRPSTYQSTYFNTLKYDDYPTKSWIGSERDMLLHRLNELVKLLPSQEVYNLLKGQLETDNTVEFY